MILLNILATVAILYLVGLGLKSARRVGGLAILAVTAVGLFAIGGVWF